MTSTTLTVAPAAASSTVKVNGAIGTSTVVSPANGATKTVVFRVTAASGTTRDYTVNVHRKDYGKYKFIVKSEGGTAIADVTLGIYTDAAATKLYKSGITDASGTVTFDNLTAQNYWMKEIKVPKEYERSTFIFKLSPVENETTTLDVTLAKSAENPYNSWQLKSLKATKGTLSPAFDPDTYKYTLSLDENTASTTITPTLADSGSKLTIGGKSVKSITVTLNRGASKKVSIKVTSDDGSRTYSVTVTRAKTSDKDIKMLKFSRGSLKPVFSPNVLSYVLTLSSTQADVALTITLSSNYSIYSVNVDGKVTKNLTIQVNKGKTKTVKITVKAQDGTKKVYVIKITRKKA